MNERTQRLVRLSSLVVLGRWEELSAFRRAAPAGEPDRAWREAVLQSHLFAGFPRLVEALGVIGAAGGLGDLDEDEVEEPPSTQRTPRGADLFGRIYGDGTPQVAAQLDAFHPLAGRWIAEHAYGRVLSRPGLGADVRELCAVASLALLGPNRQLASHVRGALRCGAALEAVHEVLVLIDPWLTPTRRQASQEVVARFAPPPPA